MKIATLREADVILNKVLVLTPLNEEKMIGFVRGMSASGPRDKTGDWAINKRCGKSKEGGVSFHWGKRSKRRKETPPWRRVAFQKD